MGKVLGDSPHVSIVDDEINGLRITIRNDLADSGVGLAYALVAAILPLLMLAVMLSTGLGPGISGRAATTVFWMILIVCPTASLVWAFLCLWLCRAVDTVILNDRVLILRRELGPVYRSLTFDLAEVCDVRHDPLIPRSFRLYHPRDFGIGGAIAFDAGNKTHRFGLDLSPIDVVRILEAVKSTASGPIGKQLHLGSDCRLG